MKKRRNIFVRIYRWHRLMRILDRRAREHCPDAWISREAW